MTWGYIYVIIKSIGGNILLFANGVENARPRLEFFLHVLYYH